jgi:hypothetical protein
MTVSSSAASPAQGWTAAPPAARGFASRFVAAFLHIATGLTLAAAVMGFGVASAIISRGIVIAGATDVATLQALSPVLPMIAVVAAGHAFAGLGTLFGGRAAAALGISLGAFDVVAGIVALVISATGDQDRFDGTGLALTFIVMGIVLAVSARAADWNTHGPVPQD